MATPLWVEVESPVDLSARLSSDTLHHFVAFGLLGMYPRKPTPAEALNIRHFAAVHLTRPVLAETLERLAEREQLFVIIRHGLANNQRPADRDALARLLGLSNGAAHRLDNQCGSQMCAILGKMLGNAFQGLPGTCPECPSMLTLLN